jgi:GTP:adenosylcobinamide-phosphate guanylyltransferase
VAESRHAPDRAAFIVLAGDRGAQDPVARLRDVPSKALAPVAGRAMLARVLDTLAELDAAAPLVLVAPESPAFQAVVAAGAFPTSGIRWLTPATSPGRSLARAFDAITDVEELLLVTADHPLLDAAWLRQLLAAARGEDAEVMVGLVPFMRVQERFPDSRRTQYRFRDVTVCGTNLFVFRSQRARSVAALWQRVEADRKRPWRIVSLLGAVNLLRYLGGYLSLDDALGALSQRTGLRIRAAMIDAPESAVDVDTIADLVCVEGILNARTAAHAAD